MILSLTEFHMKSNRLLKCNKNVDCRVVLLISMLQKTSPLFNENEHESMCLVEQQLLTAILFSDFFTV